MGIKFIDSPTVQFTVLPSIAKGGVGDTQVSAVTPPADPGFVWPGTTPGDVPVQGNLYDRARGVVPTSPASNNNLATDGADNTSSNSPSSSCDWTIDLGVARHITSARVLFNWPNQNAGGGWDGSAQSYYSDDGASWSACGAGLYVADGRGSPTTYSPTWDIGSHRYWRITLTASGGGYQPLLYTWSLFDANATGAIVRLPVGPLGTVLASAGTPLTPTYQAVLKSLGNQAVGVAQVAIAHGLGYIPGTVLLTPTSAGQIWQSAVSDVTNIYLTADAAARTCIPNVR